MSPLAAAGYHVIAPDQKGHGFSSKPLGDSGFTKREHATDIYKMMTEQLGIKDKVHVDHDIGGIVAHAYVAQFPEHVASVTWGECPLPGSTIYDETKLSRTLWDFDFQSHNPDIAGVRICSRIS